MAYPIYPINGTPYTNFHDLNLDWILQRVKEAYEAFKSLDATVDKSVRAYMDSPEFIEALQDLISEEFITETVIQQIKQQLTVVNVADYGATGDGSDQTEALAAAFAAFNADDSKTTIFFPSGTYKWSASMPQIYNRDLEFIGEHATVTPTQIRQGTDAYNSLLRCAGGHVVVRGFVAADYESPADNQPAISPQVLLQPVFLFENCAEVEIDDCHLENFWLRRGKFRTGVDTQFFSNRCGYWIWTRDCERVQMHDCSMTGRLGGEEPVWLVTNPFTSGTLVPAKFAKGDYKFFNNYFHDNTPMGQSSAAGSQPGFTILHTLGGSAEVCGNTVERWTFTGSTFNVFSHTCSVHDNTISDSTAGDLVDVTEGGRIVPYQVEIVDNLVSGGRVGKLANVDGVMVRVSGNISYSDTFVRTFATNSRYTFPNVPTPIIYGPGVDPDAPRVVRVISDNTWIRNLAAVYSGEGGIHIDYFYPDENPSTTYCAGTRKFVISNNVITAGPMETANVPVPIMIDWYPDTLYVDDNRFLAPGYTTANGRFCAMRTRARTYSASSTFGRDVKIFMQGNHFDDLLVAERTSKSSYWGVINGTADMGTIDVYSTGDVMAARAPYTNPFATTGPVIVARYNPTDIEI